MEPLFRLLKIGLIWGILGIPITTFIQLITPADITPFSNYWGFLKTIFSYGLAWWDWIFIGIICAYILTNKTIYLKAAEQLRLRHFYQELERWDRTPYVPPLLFFYMVSPPSSISRFIVDAIHNTFYQTVVNVFRDRVYINSDFYDTEPLPKQNWFKQVGFQHLASIALAITLLIGFNYYFFYEKPIGEWFSGGEKFTIPVSIYLLTWIVQQARAIFLIGTGRFIDPLVAEYFNFEEPNILWRDVFPDRPRGQAIIESWKAKTEKHNRYFSQITGRTKMDNHALAPYPFPSQELPNWAENMEAMVYDLVERKQVEEHWKKPAAQKSNVIDFSHKQRVKKYH